MKHKWTLFTFSRGDFKTLERYLNEQAERGWELERTGILARWKRTDRTDLCWCVDLAKPRQDRQERLAYAELCREAGWELASFTGSMYLFKSVPGCTPIPVQTDPELERKNYNRYYIRNSILSVVILVAYFLFLMGMGAILGGQDRKLLPMLKYLRCDHWAYEGALWAAPLWLLWAVWKLADFFRAAVKGRRNGMTGHSPRWVMWVNGWAALMAGLGAVPFFAGCIMDVFVSSNPSYTLHVLCAVWAGVLLYRALGMEKELFPRERRRNVAAGVVMAAVFVVLIAGRAAIPRESWTTSWPDRENTEGLAGYERSKELPLVHGEDMGLPVDPEKHAAYFESELTPMGRYQELRQVYGGHIMISETTQCFNAERAGLLTEALVYGYRTDRVMPLWELEPLDIPWADEAWGCVLRDDWEYLSMMVLRKGERVMRLSFPLDLTTEEALSVIRTELEK